MTPLSRLMVMPRYDDGMSEEALRNAHQEMLQNRAASAFRNVGPDDLTQFPDRNAMNPDDIMRYLMLGGAGEGL